MQLTNLSIEVNKDIDYSIEMRNKTDSIHERLDTEIGSMFRFNEKAPRYREYPTHRVGILADFLIGIHQNYRQFPKNTQKLQDFHLFLDKLLQIHVSLPSIIKFQVSLYSYE